MLFGFSNGEDATVVIGQENFESQLENQGGAADADTLGVNQATYAVFDGRLYLPDDGNNRTLVFNSIPVVNGADADFVLGQPDFTTNDTGLGAGNMWRPQGVSAGNSKLAIADGSNKRVLIFNTIPTSGAPDNTAVAADVVVGQTDFGLAATGCSASMIRGPGAVQIAGERLLVLDPGNHRVIWWNTIPTTNGEPADGVIGQPNLDTCTANTGGRSASSLSFPIGLWSDGTKVAIVDQNNNRVLLWNTFPESNNEPADLVLGQPDFESADINQLPVAADRFWYPYRGVDFSGQQLCVTDTANNRVLIWDSWPATNQQAADRVLGQPDFVSYTAHNAGIGANTLSQPTSCRFYRNGLIVGDSSYRALIYQ